MKILYLPVNIASMQPITAQAVNRLDGVEAKCFTYLKDKYIQENDDTISFPRTVSWKNPFKWVFTKLHYLIKMHTLIQWADVLHYVAEPALKSGQDLKWAKKYNKKVFVEFIGSDIRDPEFLKKINPYYADSLDNGYEYKKDEYSNFKIWVQKKFARANAKVIVNSEMKLFVNTDLLPNINHFFFRINAQDFIPKFPDKSNKKPVIVHAPSKLVAKGSNIILPLLDKLKQSYEFEYVIIHGRPRSEVLNIVAEADIFIDQIILGAYGMAAMEAMAFGKPTLCYIMPELFKNGLPEECPLVNTNPSNIEEKLIELILNPALRHEIGKKSRQFIERYHDADILAPELVKIYSQKN